MKAWMATAAALALLAGISTATAQNTPAANDKADTTMQQSGAPKVKSSAKKTSMHQSMRMRHRATHETTGAGGRIGTIGGGRNDPSIHQSVGDRDSRDFPKQH
jgi:phosphate-selective porin